MRAFASAGFVRQLGRRGQCAIARGRVLVAALACLFALNGCETSTVPGDLLQSKTDSAQSFPSAMEADTAATGSVRPVADELQAAPVRNGRRGKDRGDDLSLGRKYFRAANFAQAERHFRRAVELNPGDPESWLGLAACHDRLRRFDLADRAYERAMAIVGPTAEIQNNQGYSYLLRGDYRRARETLLQAQAQDPGNSYIRNNLDLVEARLRNGKPVH